MSRKSNRDELCTGEVEPCMGACSKLAKDVEGALCPHEVPQGIDETDEEVVVGEAEVVDDLEEVPHVDCNAHDETAEVKIEVLKVVECVAEGKVRFFMRYRALSPCRSFPFVETELDAVGGEHGSKGFSTSA